MKRLLTFLALCCLMVTGAWANVTSIDQVEENAIYTLTCSRGSLTVSSDKSKLASSTDAGTTFSPLSADYQFQFKKSGDNYYLYSVGAAKYSKNDGTLVDNIGDAAALTLNGWGNGTAQPRWDDDHCLNFGGQSQLLISNYKTGDAGNYFTIALLPLTSANDIVESRVYTLSSFNRGSFVYSSTYADGYISGSTRAGYTFNANDENCQFVFLKYGGKTYLYSLGADKFVAYGSDGLHTSATVPTEGIELLASTGNSHKATHPTVLRIDNSHQCNMSTDQGKGILTNWNNTGDDGNMLSIQPVAELTSEQLAAIKEVFRTFTTSQAPVNGVWQAGTKFYSIKEKRRGYLYANELPSIANTTAPSSDYGKWAVIANGSNFQFMNKYTKEVMTFSGTAENAEAGMTDNLDDPYSLIDIVTFNNPKFEAGYECFKIANTEAYPNDKNPKLAIWANSQALWGWGSSASNPGTGDDGSKFKFTLVEEITDVTYTVNVEGAPSAVTVTVKGITVVDNTVSLSSTATEADVVAEVVPGYYPATVTVGSDYTINVSYRKWPFETADSFANIQKWYGMNIHYGNTHAPYYDATATPNIQTDGSGYKTEDKYAWGFVLNSDGTVKVYNKAAGSGFTLYSANNDTDCALSDTNSSDFKVRLTGWTAAQASGGFCLNVEGQQYVNHQNTLLKHWTDADAGSTFNVFELDFGTKTYTVHITGNAPTDAKVLYGGQPYTDGQTISSVEVTADDITPDAPAGYAYELTVDGNDIYVNYQAVPAAGTYFRLQNRNYSTYMNANGEQVNGNADGTGLGTLWYAKDNGSGALQLMNAATGRFLGNITQSNNVSLNTGNTTTFEFEAVGDYIAFKQTGGGNRQYGHIDGGNHLVGWSTDAAATQWTYTPETPAMTDYTITVTGLPEGVTGGLLYYGQMHTSTLNAPTGLDASLLSGASVSGYKAPTVSMEGTAITVTYVSLPFVVGETYTIKGVFADKDAEWYICDSGTTAVAAAELPADKSGNWIYTGDGKFQNVKNNTRYLATGSGLTTNTTGVAFTVQDGLAEGTKTLFNGSTSYAVGKAGDISGGQYNKGEKHNTGDWTTDFFIEILSVTVPNTLTPADGAEVNSLSTVSVEFTGDNVSEGIIPFPGGQLEGTTQILPTLKNGETTVTATSVAVRTGVYNIFDITFPTGQITSGEWKLDIPQGTFYVAVPDAPGEYDPVARIKANYTVSLIPIAGKVYTIKAHFNSEELDDIYLSNDGTSMTFPTEASATQSYWVAVANDGSDAETCPWKFQSGYGDGKYLNVNGVNTTASIFDVRACDNQEGAGCYHLYNKAQNRNIGTFALNQSKNGWGSFGSGGCWSTGHNNGGDPFWTTDYIIEEVKNVDVYTVSGMGSVGVTGISEYTYASAVAAGGVLVVPAGTTLTDANFTNDANTLVVVDATAKTITLTEIIVTKPTSLDQIEQGVPYTITTYNRGAMIYTENGLSSTTKESVDVDPSDPDQQFLFVEHHGKYYFYSVGGEKFINVTGKNENNNRAVGVDAPVNTSLIFDASTGSRKADFPIVLNIDGHHVGISNSFVPAVITHYQGTADDGNMVRLTPVLGTTVDLDPIIAKFPKICPIDAATYYVTIENHEKGRQPFLFNDIQYADEITLQGASHDTSKNGYIWKVTSDGAGNITVLNAENGKGIKPKSSNYSGNITSLQYEVYPEDANYFFLKFRTGSHDRLNATASGFSNEAGKKAVTTWDGNHPDNAWKFNAVDTEGLEEYNVVITQPEGCRGYALYDGKKAGNGGFLLAPADLEQSALTAGELRGFICDGVTLTDHTITLTYTTATPVQVNYTLYLKEGDTETLLETAAEAVTEYVGQAPQHPFTVPDYVDVTYDQGVDENGLIDGNATAIKVITSYNDLMPFTPGELTTVDIDIRNHYYFHVEERTITIDGESKKLWLPCISPKAPTFDDDAAYIWRMEGDWYHGFRFHNDQLAKEGEGDGTACHITYKHKEVMSDTMEQMEGMKGETSLTEKTYTLESTTDLSIASRATLTGDADDRNSYFELVHATGNIQHYNGEPAEWQFRLMDHKNLYLNFRDYSAVGDNPDSLLCLYGAGYGDNASSFTFHKNEVCTEDDRQAVLAMIDAIEKGAVGALIDKDAQEYQDLLTLKGRIEDTTIGCTRALFDIYTEKLVNANKERKVATDGEAYRLAVRTKQGRNFYLKDDGTYTTDSLAASIYVLGSSADGTKKILAGNNNAALYYFRNSGLTQAAYETDACDLSCELMANKETVVDVLDATGAAKYATVCLTDGNGKVATMTSPDKAVTGGDCDWEAQDVVYMNDDLSSAIVMEPVPYPYNKPKFAVGSPDDHEGGYASIWLPYPMIFPDGVEVYRATDVESDGLLVLKKVNTDRVVAAGGYIIRDPNKASTMTVLPAPANPDDVEYSETNAFVGSTENPLVVKEEGSWSAFVEALGNPTGTPYVLAKKNEVIGYYKYNAGTDDLLPKGKAIWFSNYKADSSAECLRFTFEEVISAIEALHGNTDNAEIYDLQGHRLNKVEKGQVNVINGKKVMFK